MKKQLLFSLVLFGLITLLSSCSDDDDDNNNSPSGVQSGVNVTSGTSGPTPGPKDIDGGLWAYKSMSVATFPVIGTIRQPGRSLFANFSNDKLKTFYEVDSISCNGIQLSSTGSKIYAYSDPFGSTDLSGDLEWKVTSTEAVGSFTLTQKGTFPVVRGIKTSPSTITRGQDFTITIDTVQNTDSLFFLAGKYYAHVPATQKSFTFKGQTTSLFDKPTTPSQNGEFYAGVQVLGYNYQTQKVNGQKLAVGYEEAAIASIPIK